MWPISRSGLMRASEVEGGFYANGTGSSNTLPSSNEAVRTRLLAPENLNDRDPDYLADNGKLRPRRKRSNTCILEGICCIGIFASKRKNNSS